jgi:hypothetical protein|tara:strand:- start:7315 stop:7776 length:462 start_codon:yes stop_codon:yes gene_type:complete
MNKKILFLSLMIINLSTYSQIFKDKYIMDATKVAEIWMNNINSSKYAIAYNQYSDQVKENSDSIYWSKAITQLMDEFGEIVSREIISSEFKSNIENLGDGFYVFIEYKSVYKKINECSEYLLLGQDDNIKWKILRYDFSYISEDQDLDEKSSN